MKVSKGSYSYNGDEETMKALVAEHGAVVTGWLFLFITIIHYGLRDKHLKWRFDLVI